MRGGSFAWSCGGGFAAFVDRGFVVFDSGVFVLSEVFLGSLTSLDFLASLDFKLRNTSLQRSWGCDACGVGAGGVRFLPPSPPPTFCCPPAVEELLYVLVELAESGQPVGCPGPAGLLPLQPLPQGTLRWQQQDHQAQQDQCPCAAQSPCLEKAEQTMPPVSMGGPARWHLEGPASWGSGMLTTRDVSASGMYTGTRMPLRTYRCPG